MKHTEEFDLGAIDDLIGSVEQVVPLTQASKTERKESPDVIDELIAAVEEARSSVTGKVEKMDLEGKRKQAMDSKERLVLDTLVRDESPVVRSLVCCNPNTNPDVLSLLAEEGNEFVKMLVAHNPSTPAEALNKLSESPNAEILAALEHNPSISQVALFRIKDKLSKLRSGGEYA